MKITDGGTSLVVMILMFIVIAVASIGFLAYVYTSDKQTGIIANDTVNLSGITTTGEIFNGTTATTHQLAGIMPNLIWVIIAFMIVTVLFIVGISFKR